ncbi:MAG: hypothetical protein HOK72_08510, partial [Flavobacteriales bacterium]|nr:hypothetical protein [Flavobacteriales bacterium]
FPNGSREQDLELMCDTVSIAGKSIQDTPDIQYGVRRAIAYSVPQFNPLSLSFYCTEKLEEKKKLDAWQNLCVNTGIAGAGEIGTFDVGYYDDYAKNSKIVVTKLDMAGNKVFTFEYVEAYPKQVMTLDLSHATASAPMKVQAMFNYTYWKDTTTTT